MESLAHGLEPPKGEKGFSFIYFFFFFTAVWTKQCHACTERDADTCRANQQSQTCATDVNSLGITECFSAATRYRDMTGKVQEGFVRGCVDCTSK